MNSPYIIGIVLAVLYYYHLIAISPVWIVIWLVLGVIEDLIKKLGDD
jgi:hypothetical protein